MDETNAAVLPQGNPSLAGWACFGVGMGLMLLSLGLFFLYGPLFLAAFVISIVSMAKGRMGAGVALLLCTLIIPPVVWFGLLAVNVSDAVMPGADMVELEDLHAGSGSDQLLEVSGIVVEAPASSASGTVFTVAQTAKARDRIEVHWAQPQFPAQGPDGKPLPPEETVGLSVVLTGRWDGSVFDAKYLVVKDTSSP